MLARKQAPVAEKIKVLLAEDHAIVRQGLKALLEAENDIEVVGEAKTGREAVQMTTDLSPEVVVMDISMPLLNGIEATRQIKKSIPDAKVIILSAHGDGEFAEQMFSIGASAYLIKETSADALAQAVRDVYRGLSVECSLRGAPGSPGFDRKGGAKSVNRDLSSREIEVLQLIAEGLANKQIAGELSISIKTVEKHRQNIMNKLSIHETAGLTRYAVSTGIIETDPGWRAS